MNQSKVQEDIVLSQHEHEEDRLIAETAAVVCRSESLPLHVGKRRIKELFTNHWDLDYLPRAEAEAALSGLALDPSQTE